jgi:hypothetical protein
MEKTEISREIKDYLKCLEYTKDEVYDFIDLVYEDTEKIGFFGTKNIFKLDEPFFGMFWYKSDGNNHSISHNPDMCISLSIEYAYELYQFLKKYFGEENIEDGK